MSEGHPMSSFDFFLQRSLPALPTGRQAVGRPALLRRGSSSG